jgi:hypothetical protein
MRCSLRNLILACTVLLLALSTSARAEIGGAAGRATTYSGVLNLQDGNRCQLSIQVERVSFLMTTVGGKYRFVRMLVDCQKQGLTLSSMADRLDVTVDNSSIPGVLSLQRSDSALWDGLDAGMRQTLAYPAAIRPGEPVYLFAYFPADQVKAMPRGFSFTIASTGQTVTLQSAATAARA